MPDIRRTYAQGRMNLDIENRLLPDGEYREAFNAIVYNNESGEEGSVRKAYSNKKLTNLDLGENPKCVGGYSHSARNRVYWLVVSDSGSFLIEYDFNNEIATFVLKDTRALGSRVFDLKEDCLCTGINIISHEEQDKELFLMTDDNMQPLCFNIKRAKSFGENGFEKEDIYLIKKPPRYAPVVTPVYTNDRSNNLEDKFLTFSYRYKYLDGEYSALSSYTNYVFNPKKFELDYFTLVNKGMVNKYNAVKIDFNTGDKRVIEIQLVVKETNSNTPYLIETYNKSKEGFGDNEIRSFIFSNQKLYSALAERELYRLFDNVPLKAKSLTVIGNRAIFGNYLEFFDIKDSNGNDIVIDYDVSLVSEKIEQGLDLENNFPTSNTFTFENAIGITYTQEYVMYFYLSIKIGIINVYENEFSFILPQDYTDLDELVASPDFIAFVEVINSHFVSNYNSEGQYEVDPDYALNTETSIDFAVISGVPTFTVNPIIYEDTANANAIVEVDLSFNSSSNVGITSLLNTSSCKSNKNYEVGLVYMEDFNRATTTLTSKNNTLFIPQQYSIFKNKLRVTLNNLPPYWADRYKLVVKTNPLQYQTIFVNEFYNQDNYVWAKLQSDNKDKVKVGDTLILKVGGEFIANQPIRIKVLEIKEFNKDFILNNQDEEGNDIIETSGVYMKIRPEGFSMDLNDYTIKQSGISHPGSSGNPVFYLDLFTETTPSLTELSVSQGSSIYIFINSNRKYNSGWENVTYENTFFTQRNYATLEEWFNEVFLNVSFIPGIEDTSGDTENYAPNLELVRGHISYPFGGSFQVFTENPSGKLYLRIVGLRSGGSKNRKGYGSAKIVIRNSTGIYVFETDPRQADSDIFYETEQTFDIVGGQHQGNIQNQNNATLEPAIIDLDFYNCFSQGNGVESFRVRDEFNTRFLNIDLRPTTTTIEPYKQVRRFADLTYSEPYVQSSNINGLNVFNLSTANFKDDLDKQFGSIQKIHSRENDIVVLQEQKAGKVLFNKDALFTAAGDATLTNSTSVLGQYLPYKGNRGIGKNPESFSIDDFGRIKYASIRTGSIIRLSLDGIEDIIYGVKNFFRDLFINRQGGKILSGYDPYLDLTTFTIEENINPIPIYNCGNEIVKDSISEPFAYTLQLNSLTGNIVLNYNIVGTATIQVVHNGITEVVSGVSGIGNVTIERDNLSITTASVIITPVSETISFSITNNCPIGIPLDIVLVVLNDENDSEKTILNRFRSDLNGFIQNEDLFTEGPVTRFETLSGLEGQSLFPIEGSVITIQSVKGNSNTGSFLPIDECNRIGYLISNTEYTELTVNDLLDQANYLTLTETIQGIGQNTFTGNFVFNRPIGTEKLYLIWDYTNRKPIVVNDNIIVNQGEEITFNPLANDTTSGTVQVTITQQPTNGTAVVNLNNTITYTHNDTETTSDVIEYQVNNGVCTSDATIFIVIENNTTTCVKLISITSEDSMGEIFYRYVDCETGEEVNSSFINTTGILNICIKANRLLIINGESVTTVFGNCSGEE